MLQHTLGKFGVHISMAPIVPSNIYRRLSLETVYIQVSQKWRTKYLLPYRGCLNVHEKNMEKMFPTKKSIIFIIIINDNTM
jgi:hypothetical protein